MQCDRLWKNARLATMTGAWLKRGRVRRSLKHERQVLQESFTSGEGTTAGRYTRCGRQVDRRAVHSLRDHHVSAVPRLGRGSRQGREPRRRRGRSPATSLDGDEIEPIIDGVMVRLNSHLTTRGSMGRGGPPQWARIDAEQGTRLCRPAGSRLGPCVDREPGTESSEGWAWFASNVRPRSSLRMATTATPTMGRERPP